VGKGWCCLSEQKNLFIILEDKRILLKYTCNFFRKRIILKNKIQKLLKIILKIRVYFKNQKNIFYICRMSRVIKIGSGYLRIFMLDR